MNFSIKKVINLTFNSNTFIIESNSNNAVYLIDIGNANGVLDTLNCNQEVKGVFLTHDHYDHISGLNQIITRFPNCVVYCSQYVKKALTDSKTNLSFYHNDPIVYDGKNCKDIVEGDRIELFDLIFVDVIETPGHNDGCLTFKLGHIFFTGDALIPGVQVVTKLKGGNKTLVKESIRKIQRLVNLQDKIYPGHGDEIESAKMNWDFYLNK